MTVKATVAVRSPGTSSSTAVTVTVRGVAQLVVVKGSDAGLATATDGRSEATSTRNAAVGFASSTTVKTAVRSSSSGVASSSASATVSAGGAPGAPEPASTVTPASSSVTVTVTGAAVTPW